MRVGAANGYRGNFHEAGFYSSDDEFLSLIVPFVAEGVTAAEPVIIGYDDRKCGLLREALPTTAGVSFITDAALYASPARAIEAYRREFVLAAESGAEQVRIAGDVPHEGNGGRFEGWDRYESAVNVVWRDYPVWSRCLYDATTVPDDVRDVVERTHRRLVGADGGAVRSPRFQEITEFEALPTAPDPLEEAGPPAEELVDAQPGAARRLVARIAAGVISPTATEQLTAAVAEAVRNGRRHGRPPTTVRGWVGTDRVVVTVHDTGPGLGNPLAGLVPDERADQGPGRGLWLIHKLVHVDVALLFGNGFTVRLRAGRLPSRPLNIPANPRAALATPRSTESDEAHIQDLAKEVSETLAHSAWLLHSLANEAARMIDERITAEPGAADADHYVDVRHWRQIADESLILVNVVADRTFATAVPRLHDCANSEDYLRLQHDSLQIRGRLQRLVAALALVEEMLADLCPDGAPDGAGFGPERDRHRAVAMSCRRLMAQLTRCG